MGGYLAIKSSVTAVLMAASPALASTRRILPPAEVRLRCDGGFVAGLWGGFSARDAYFNLPQHRHDLLWLVPLDWHDPLFLQVDSLSFHVQLCRLGSQQKGVSGAMPIV